MVKDYIWVIESRGRHFAKDWCPCAGWHNTRKEAQKKVRVFANNTWNWQYRIVKYVRLQS